MAGEELFEIWSNEYRVRIIKVSRDRVTPNGVELFNVARVYSDTKGSTKTFAEHVAAYDSMGLDGLAHWGNTYVASGREQWDWGKPYGDAKKIVDSFRKSATKSGFHNHGELKRRV